MEHASFTPLLPPLLSRSCTSALALGGCFLSTFFLCVRFMLIFLSAAHSVSPLWTVPFSEYISILYCWKARLSRFCWDSPEIRFQCTDMSPYVPVPEGTLRRGLPGSQGNRTFSFTKVCLQSFVQSEHTNLYSH